MGEEGGGGVGGLEGFEKREEEEGLSRKVLGELRKGCQTG